MELDVVVLCGSLRKGSLNQALAEVAVGAARSPLRLDLWRPADVLPRLSISPGDPMPLVVEQLRSRVAEAAAVLFATPEFNRSVPGYVKDVVDWLGIRVPRRPLLNKVCALMSASLDRHGGAFAQLELAELSPTRRRARGHGSRRRDWSRQSRGNRAPIGNDGDRTIARSRGSSPARTSTLGPRGLGSVLVEGSFHTRVRRPRASTSAVDGSAARPKPPPSRRTSPTNQGARNASQAIDFHDPCRRVRDRWPGVQGGLQRRWC
jgi:NAD(P)H-dependent FMN reductase